MITTHETGAASAAHLPQANYKTRTSCRACGEERLRLFLDLGTTPLANSFLSSPAEFASEVVYPLRVFFCETCSLVQLADVVDPRIMFSNYLYVTGTSDTISAHNREYANTVADLLDLGSDDLVVEVASNNGRLLKCFQDLSVRTLGVEPAANIAEMAVADGVNTVNQFFNSETARQIRSDHGPARAVIGNNVLAHVDETRDFLSGCSYLIDHNGMVIVEVPYLREFVESIEYDTVYHEHLCYFSVTSLCRLFEAVGMSIMRVDRLPIHGGSIRVYAGKRERFPEHSEDVQALLSEEAALGLINFEFFERFAEKVDAGRRRLITLLERLRLQGKSVAAYGAPAKGNTLLNYCGIDTNLVSFAVDKNPLKVGLFTPGAHLPVKPVSEVLRVQPDYLLILAWNFADEIMQQQAEYKSRGGKFIIPIPEPRIIEQ